MILRDADMAELADAIDLGSIPKGWGFKSLYPHQKVACGLFPHKKRRNPKRVVSLFAVFTAATFGSSLGY